MAVPFQVIFKEISKSLEIFLSSNTIHSSDRSDHLVWYYDDTYNKKTISIVFTKEVNLGGEAMHDYILNNGYVLEVPNFWFNVPKVLGLEYLLTLLIQYYQDNLGLQYDGNFNILDETGCPCNQAWLPNWRPSPVYKATSAYDIKK